MITPTIPDDVFKACAGVIVTDKAGQHALKSALLEYDKLVCEPLRELIDKMAEVDPRILIEIMGQAKDYREQRDSALARVREMTIILDQSPHHPKCKANSESKIIVGQQLNDCQCHKRALYL